MSWNPDATISTAVQQILSRAKKDALTTHREEFSRDVARLASRGIMGGPVLSAAETGAVKTLRAAGERGRREVLEFLGRSYGRIPPDALPWIREMLTQQVVGLASGLAKELEDRRQRAGVSIGGAREALDQAAFALRRDLEIDHGPRPTGD